NKYWMPSEIGLSCILKLEMPLIPAFSFAQTATLQDYTINEGLPDSLFRNEHSVAEFADSVDSVHWVAMRTIPLAKDEASAYHMFDSIAKIPAKPQSFSPIGLLFSVIPGTDVYQYNRVEGSHFELGTSLKFSDNWPLTMDARVGYGIGDNRFKYSIGLTQGITWSTKKQMNANFSIGSGDVNFSGIKNEQDVTSSFSARIYDQYIARGTAYDPIVNTLTSLFLHSDYPNYFRAHGFDMDFNIDPTSVFSAQLHFKNEIESSLPNVTSFSLLDKRDTFRSNPAITDGRLHEIGGSLSVTPDLGNWDGSASCYINYSAPGIGSQFNYVTGQFDLSLEGKMGGWGKGWFDAKYSDLLSGALPAQNLFYFEARDDVVAPRGVFRTMYPFEFQGDQTWSLMYEQNFYDLPTRLIGIKMPVDLHWFGFVNVAGASLSDKTNAFQPPPIATLDSTPFAEAGFGIGNILNVLRFDATWRLTHRIAHNFFVTGTVALSF
ncbi:MAG TPA: hypothetical protein VFX22_11105, partial [Candidatus Kapabacteria bacterium]|nr:hypothetical protein [Candidatus Kapabacteria bacterium]